MTTETDKRYSSPMQFPCDFIVKVMGNSQGDFQQEILTLVAKHFSDISEKDITQRHSKEKNYIALTIQVHAKNQEQLDRLYEDLSACKSILMAL